MRRGELLLLADVRVLGRSAPWEGFFGLGLPHRPRLVAGVSRCCWLLCACWAGPHPGKPLPCCGFAQTYVGMCGSHALLPALLFR